MSELLYPIYPLAQTFSNKLNLKKIPNFNQWLSAIWRRRVMLSLWKEFFLAVPSQKSHPSLQLIRDRRQSAASLDCVGGKIQKCLRHIYVLKIRPLLITYQFESFSREFFDRRLWINWSHLESFEIIWSHLRSFEVLHVMRQQNYKHAKLAVFFCGVSETYFTGTMVFYFIVCLIRPLNNFWINGETNS